MGSGSSAVAKAKQIGNDYFKAGDYSKASKAYSKAINYDPDNYIILSNRSVCNLKLGNFHQALEDALACTRISPNWNKSYYRLSSVFKAINLLSESLIYAEISQQISDDQAVKSLISELNSIVTFKGRSTVLAWGPSNPRPNIIKSLEGLQVVEVACGVSHLLAVTTNSLVFAWGDNTYSQCGVDGSCEVPRLITELLSAKVKAVVAGGGHSLAICQDGSVYAWGINSNGQCGLAQSSKIPIKVNTPGKIKGGSAGLGHTFLLMEDNRICAAGWNSNGQLGTGNKENLNEFRVCNIGNANFISCGAIHSLIVLVTGEILATGGNSCGQLGLGNYSDVSSFTKIKSLSEISFCRCGEEFSIAVSSKNKVYSFGLGNVKQLGYSIETSCIPREITDLPSNLGVEYIACTKASVLAVTRNLCTYAWGMVPNYSGDDTEPSLPIELSALKRKRVREIQCLRDSFIICTEYVNENSYVANLPLSPVEAGRKHIAKVFLLDSRLMFIIEPADRVAAVCFNSQGQLSKGQCQVFWDNSEHVIELQITEAGYHTLYVFCNGLQLKYSPMIYTVSHGAFDHAVAYTHSANFSVNAGVGFFILIKLFDKYDNLVAKDPELEFKLNISGKCEVVSFEEGCYRVKVTCSEIGQHQVEINDKGKNVKIVIQDLVNDEELIEIASASFINVQVFPGLIFAKKCSVEGILDEYTAGDSINFSIISRDEYGNTTWHRSKPWALEIPISVELQESIDFCSTLIKGKWTFSGKFIIKVTYEGIPIFNSEVLVKPGLLFLPNTSITGDGCKDFLFLTPTKREFIVEFFDEYFNGCPSEIKIESTILHDIAKLSNYSYLISYHVSAPGLINFNISTVAGTIPIQVNVTKHPKLIQQEIEQQMLEARRLKKIEEERRKAEAQQKMLEAKRLQQLEEEKKQAEVEQRKAIEEEMRRRAELRKRQKLIEDAEKKQKELEDAEMAKRQKTMERIKLQEITKKRAFEALQKLEEEKKNKEPKKWKRTGGGFIVPFINEDDS